MLAAILTAVLFLGIIRILAPKASASVRGVFPRADRAVDRDIRGQTERRGAVLAALAAANIAEATGSVLTVGIAAAICFRLRPKPTAVVLGTFGMLAALQKAFGESCVGLADDRRALALTFVIGGLAAFAVLRLMFTGAGLARGGGASLLAVFGLIQLGTFVAAPFGVSLAATVGVGDSLTAVALLYALVVVAAALLPDFTVSVIGVALLAATLSVDTVLGDTCTGQQGDVVLALLAFAAVWWGAGLVVGRRK